MPIRRTGMNIKRGNVYFARLDPTQGTEINKTRPVLVISNDIIIIMRTQLQ